MKLNDILTKPLKEILDMAPICKVDYYTNDDGDIFKINVIYKIEEENSKKN